MILNIYVHWLAMALLAVSRGPRSSESHLPNHTSRNKPPEPHLKAEPDTGLMSSLLAFVCFPAMKKLPDGVYAAIDLLRPC